MEKLSITGLEMAKRINTEGTTTAAFDTNTSGDWKRPTRRQRYLCAYSVFR